MSSVKRFVTASILRHHISHPCSTWVIEAPLLAISRTSFKACEGPVPLRTFWRDLVNNLSRTCRLLFLTKSMARVYGNIWLIPKHTDSIYLSIATSSQVEYASERFYHPRVLARAS